MGLAPNALGMNSIAKGRTLSSRAYLKEVVADGGGVRLSTSLLLLDTVAAIGFAAGLAAEWSQFRRVSRRCCPG
jgi:ATP-binding cassette subfamily C protein CydD